MPSRKDRRASASIPSDSPSKLKLLPVSPAELDAWQDYDMDVDSDATLSEPQPDDLDEPWPYTFQSGDSVWVRTVGGQWYPGRVTSAPPRKGSTQKKEGLFYPVVFDGKLRKFFAPLNGEIKPDIIPVRRLLKEAGWL
ncbi:hypothetical protein HGRIS_014746 [Hohenbuehelia grisea]|uniref:PWWP domain-containing protein n=1 Tax=Hohenbuehelia grisea TaxID=104357 RepID=A0ABR3IQL1_9AGAR